MPKMFPTYNRSVTLATCVLAMFFSLIFPLLGWADSASYKTSYQDELKTAGKDALSKIRAVVPDKPHCLLDMQATDGYVTNVSRNVEAAGLQLGDQILAYDEIKFVDDVSTARYIYARPPSAKLRLTIQRNEQHISLVLPCTDGHHSTALQARLAQSLIDGNWEGCLAIAGKLDDEYPTKPSKSKLIKMKLACTYAKAEKLGFGFGDAHAGYMHEEQHRHIDEARFIPGGIASIADSVRNAVTVLRSYGYDEYANDIERRFQHHTHK